MAKPKAKSLGSGMAAKAGRALAGRAQQIEQAVSGGQEVHHHSDHPNATTKQMERKKEEQAASQSIQDWIESGR